MAISLIYGEGTLNGTASDDFIFGYNVSGSSANTVINAGAGDDFVMGDIGNFWVPTAGYSNQTIETALNIDQADTWYTEYAGTNPLLANNYVPTTMIMAEASGTGFEYYKVTIGAGEAIVIDVDFGSHAIGLSDDIYVQIVDASGTVLASDDDSNVDDGLYGSTSSLDSYLTYTAATAGVYYIKVGQFPGSTAFDTNATYILNVSVTGHTATGVRPGGADTINGGDGSDSLFGMDGNDTMDGGTGNDFLSGGSGADTIHGGDGADIIAGGYNHDTLYGDAGNDTFLFEDFTSLSAEPEFLDAVDGGTETDTLDFTALTSRGIIVDFAAGTYDYSTTYGGAGTVTGVENVIGSAQGDTLTGDANANYFQGLGGNDTLNGGDGNDYLDGGQGDDSINGGNGLDIVDYYYSAIGGVTVNLGLGTAQNTGGAGTDTFTGVEILLGTAYNDVLTGVGISGGYVRGYSGNDVIYAAIGADNLDGGDGIDTLNTSLFGGTYIVDLVTGLTNFGSETMINFENIVGGSGSDTFYGTDAINVMNGASGDDILDGRAGADIMIGGLGNDIFYVDNVDDEVVELSAQGIDQVYSSVSYSLAGTYVERLTLTGVANLTAAGNGQANRLTGNDGNNRLNGGAGADILAGGLGDDTYVVDNVDDLVQEATGAGTDTIEASVTYSLGGLQVENITLTGSANIDATGNSMANYLKGNSGNNILNGSSGADTMEGGLGNDVYYVDVAGDTVIEKLNQGTDEIRTGLATYTLGANVEKLTATSAIAHVFTGNSLENTLTGGSGNDTLNGSGGADIMIGGAGDDIYWVDNVGDVVTELSGGGTDTVNSAVNYSLNGTYIEALMLTGAGNTNGVGNSLANVITGSLGNNILRGGLGNDTLTGRAGNDTFAFDTALGSNNIDEITDFNVADDTIRLSRAIFAAVGPNGTLDADAFRIGSVATTAAHRIIYNSTTGNLFYDADGNGAGAAVQFAHLSSGLALTNNDFFIIA